MKEKLLTNDNALERKQIATTHKISIRKSVTLSIYHILLRSLFWMQIRVSAEEDMTPS